jgi:hypothetical protein
MKDGDYVRSLNEQERYNMKLIYEITTKRREMMTKAEESMHHEFDKM